MYESSHVNTAAIWWICFSVPCWLHTYLLICCKHCTVWRRACRRHVKIPTLGLCFLWTSCLEKLSSISNISYKLISEDSTIQDVLLGPTKKGIINCLNCKYATFTISESNVVSCDPRGLRHYWNIQYVTLPSEQMSKKIIPKALQMIRLCKCHCSSNLRFLRRHSLSRLSYVHVHLVSHNRSFDSAAAYRDTWQ